MILANFRIHIVSLAVLMVISSGCSAPGLPLSSGVAEQGSKWDRLAQEKNEEMDLHPVELAAYARQVGARLSAPGYQRFAVNLRFTVSGTVKAYRGLQSDVAWIEVEKKGGSKGYEEDSFSYYAPLKKGAFRQDVRLFAGKGEYRVTVRLPSDRQKDRFYEIARFEVLNVNPKRSRDIAFTRAGHSADLKLTEPDRGYVRADGMIDLKGAVRSDRDQRVMIRIEKNGEQWEHLLSLRNGKFESKIPLYYGKGVHKLTVLVPDPERENYFNEAASLLVENRSDQKREPIEHFKHYQERGIKLEYPLAGGDRARMKYRIKGRIDPAAPYAGQTKHLIVQTKKDGQEATYFIPVKNYRFDDTFWLRFGKGRYEVTVNVPEITEENRDYFRFFGVARFHVINTASEDRRNLLPSRGIQSDHPTIRQLAEEITRGKRGEREKALSIYEYVAKNIHYDVRKFKNDEFEYDDSALKTLREKQGVCQDYSFLTIALFRSIGMEARFIQGYAEGIRHAWVEVKVDGKWLTMDPTWGSGYINQNDRFVKRYTTQYFDPDPAMFAKTHTRTGVMY